MLHFKLCTNVQTLLFFFSLSSTVDVYCPSRSVPDDVRSSGSVWRRRWGGQWRRTIIPMATKTPVLYIII